MTLLLGIIYVSLISSVFAQGFIPEFRQLPPQRRQLTPIQQSHIFNDVQQHRFSLNQNQLFDQQKQFGDKVRQNNVLVEPSIQIQIPSQTTFINNQLSNSQQVRFPERTFPSITQQQQQQHHTQTNFVPNFIPHQHQQLPHPASSPPTFRNQFQSQQQQQQQQQNHLQQQASTNRIQHFPQNQSPTIHQRSVQNQQSFNHGQFQPSVRFPPTSESFLPTPQNLQGNGIPPQQFLQNDFNNQNQFFQRPEQQQPIRPSQPLPPNDFIQSQVQQQFTQDFSLQQQQQQQQQQHQQQQQQFLQQPTQQTFVNSKEEEQRLRELQEKQKIIQKHEQFVQKQYQKQQSKVKQLHEEFVEQQHRIKEHSIGNNQNQKIIRNPYSQVITNSRGLFPYENDVFQRAVKLYEETHPTVRPPTTTTTTTTTEATSIEQDLISPNKNGEISEDELEKLLRNHRQQLLSQLQTDENENDDDYVTEKPKPIRPKSKVKSTKALGRDDLLKQLKLALAEAPQDLGTKNYSSMDIVLPGGQKVQVIRTSDPNLIKNADSDSILTEQEVLGQQQSRTSITTTQLDQQSPTDTPFNYAELAKSGLLPPGSDFEVIRQNEDGVLQPIKDLPTKKKVTFVYLEEQDDGSYKVQGVKGNGEKEAKTKGAEVDNIIKRINNGEIQLPPPSNKRSILPSSTPSSLNNLQLDDEKINHRFSSPHSIKQQQPFLSSSTLSVIPLGISSTESNEYHTTPRYTTTRKRLPTQQQSTTTTTTTTTSTTSRPPPPPPPQTITTTESSTNYHFNHSPSPYSTLATIRQQDNIRLPAATPSTYFINENYSQLSSTDTPIYRSTFIPTYETSTAASQHKTTVSKAIASQSSNIARELLPPGFGGPIESSSSSSSSSSNIDTERHPIFDDNSRSTVKSSTINNEKLNEPTPTNGPSELIRILKSNGLHAMAKYLKQSGLDVILNETGPYTVFVPTDRAFKSLLIQLGGPERAEEKFKANPRLLSGLLLHHVIPGSFLISSLQDEMTGVSLAGTQLRVNQYHLQDGEFNDVTITTVNGAKIVSERQDISIPQGIAHAVDRVMFPLPVGDLLQTLQSDRERRFTHFLRALYASGISDILQNKDSSATTYTLFAPVDSAFSNLTEINLNKMVTDKDVAQKFVMKFISPNTLFSAGMSYYTLRDSLSAAHSITLQKTSTGKIKVDDSQIITSNIPATNGVIHAIDSLL